MWNLTLRKPAFISLQNLAFLHKGKVIFNEALEIKNRYNKFLKIRREKKGKKQQNKHWDLKKKKSDNF